MIDLKALRKDPRRWLCTACDAEGRGRRPDVCPACGCPDSWFATASAANDPRPMSQVFGDLLDIMLGAGPRKTLH